MLSYATLNAYYHSPTAPSRTFLCTRLVTSSILDSLTERLDLFAQLTSLCTTRGVLILRE